MEFNNLKIDFTEEQSMVNASAKEFCADRGYEFKIMTEDDLGIK